MKVVFSKSAARGGTVSVARRSRRGGKGSSALPSPGPMTVSRDVSGASAAGSSETSWVRQAGVSAGCPAI